MTRPKSPNTERLNLALTKDTMQKIKRLQKKLGASSKTEVIRRAIDRYAEANNA